MCTFGAERVEVLGPGGVGLALLSSAGGGFIVKLIEKDGPAALNGMVRVGDKLVGVGGEDVRSAVGERIRDLARGVPESTVRLGLERIDRITGRTFMYEINVQRAARPQPASGNDRELPPERAPPPPPPASGLAIGRSDGPRICVTKRLSVIPSSPPPLPPSWPSDLGPSLSPSLSRLPALPHFPSILPPNCAG